jgi:transketolase
VVILGDGELDEGAVWEAAMTAAKHKLANLTAVIDYNKLQSYGPTAEVLDLEPLADKWRAFGFATVECNGHDVAALRKMLARPPSGDRPGAVICHTVKGKGIPMAEHDAAWHHKSRLTPDEVAAITDALGAT